MRNPACRPLVVLCFAVMTLGLLGLPAAHAQVINYPNGFAGSTGQISLVNGASPLAGSTIRLTTSGLFGAANNAWYETPVNVQAFTTTFTFTETCPADCGDGFGFMIISTSNPSSPGYTYSGGSGAQLSWSQCGGAGNTDCPAINAILVKFDLYNVQTSSPGADLTGFYSGGTYPQAPNNPQYDMAPSGIDMQSGDLMRATLSYNGTLLTETVTDTVTGATYTNSYAANIPSLVGGDTAYVGFGGSTGAATVTQSLSSWTYTVESPGQAAVPVFSPVAGTYAGSQSITLSSSSSGAVICYNTTGSPATNGSTGCTTGTLYIGPVTVSSSETLYAVAGGTGYSDSPVVDASYVIQASLATPTFLPAAGTYTLAQLVTISDTTLGATIYYTTNGTTPTSSSTKYTGPITVSSTETLKAIAISSGGTGSAVGSAAYTINLLPVVATPVFSPAAGVYTAAQSVTISEGTSGATIYYTTDGTTPTSSSTKYTGPITVSSTETLMAIGAATGDNNSAVASAAYFINLVPIVATPAFSPAGGAYTAAQSVTISDATSGATIYYTTDGTTPTTSSTAYSGPITVSSTETLKAIAVAMGDSESAVAFAAYNITSSPASVATPAFSPAGGTYSYAQSVTISDATSGATIYYTTDGTTPTSSSTQYSGPIVVSSTETVEAIAVATGEANSTVASAAYTITSALPNFTLGASPALLTVDSGDQGTVTLAVTPVNGFDSPVTFACSGLPAGAACSFAPATVTPAGTAATTQLTISAGAQSSALQPGSRPFFPFTALALTVCFFGWRKPRCWHHWLVLAVAYAGLGLLFGCGASSRGGATSPTPTPTPTTSMVTVTATSGMLQGATTITLTLN